LNYTPEGRNAVDLHHYPEGSIRLARGPGPLVRLAFQILQENAIVLRERSNHFRDTVVAPGTVLRTNRTLRMRPPLTFNSLICDALFRVNSRAAWP
jgi:hypothetical protein